MNKMKTVILVSSLLLLSACSIMPPSTWDDNESKGIVDVVVSVRLIQCDSDDLRKQLNTVHSKLNWLTTYTELNNTTDVSNMLKLFDDTLRGIIERETISPTYCKIKRKVLKQQSKNIALAIMARY